MTDKLYKQADNLISKYIFNGLIKPNENIVISYINDKKYSRFLSTRDEEYFEFEDPSDDRYDHIFNYIYDKQSMILRSLCRQKGINDLFNLINEYLTHEIIFYDYGDDYDFVANYDAHVFYTNNLRCNNVILKEYENLVGVEFDRNKIYITYEEYKYQLQNKN